ncbi:MAG: hypothetical protein ABI145_06285 [Steroidobacteraceae bacterium]
MRLPLIVPLSCLIVLGACGGREEVKSSYIGTASMNQDQVTQLLTQQNFTEVTGLHKNGLDWVGEAQKDGHSVSFDIAANGTIHTK